MYRFTSGLASKARSVPNPTLPFVLFPLVSIFCENWIVHLGHTETLVKWIKIGFLYWVLLCTRSLRVGSLFVGHLCLLILSFLEANTLPFTLLRTMWYYFWLWIGASLVAGLLGVAANRWNTNSLNDTFFFVFLLLKMFWRLVKEVLYSVFFHLLLLCCLL